MGTNRPKSTLVWKSRKDSKLWEVIQEQMHQINSSNAGVLKMATEASFVQQNGKIIILSLPFLPQGVGSSRHSHSVVAADAPKCLTPVNWGQIENIHGGNREKEKPTTWKKSEKPMSACNAERWSCKHTAELRSCLGRNEREPNLRALFPGHQLLTALSSHNWKWMGKSQLFQEIYHFSQELSVNRLWLLLICLQLARVHQIFSVNECWPMDCSQTHRLL